MDKVSRQDCNKAILAYLSDYIDRHKDMRFIQALWGCGLVNREQAPKNTPVELGISSVIEDRFYEESSVTLAKIQRVLKEEFNVLWKK